MTVLALPSNDRELLDRCTAGSREAFAELVERYADLVYSAARRQLADSHLAEDVTQAVFTLLWTKAGSIGVTTVLPAWLHRATGYCCANARRIRTNQRRHEEKAARM